MAWGALCRLFPPATLDALPRTAGRRKAIHEIAGGSIWAKRRHLTYADVDCHSFCSHQASSKKGQLKSERHGRSPTIQARHVLQPVGLHVRERPRASDHDHIAGAGRVIHASVKRGPPYLSALSLCHQTYRRTVWHQSPQPTPRRGLGDWLSAARHARCLWLSRLCREFSNISSMWLSTTHRRNS
jgi:hypothetical protein